MSDFWKDYEPEPTSPAPMTTDRALDLALEAFSVIAVADNLEWIQHQAEQQITAIKQTRSAPVQPLAYLYHDATSPELANPMFHSTLLVFAGDRRPELRGETPLCLCTQPAAPVPLTERQRSKMYRAAVLRGDSIMVRSDYELGISDTEAAHGITAAAPEKGNTP